MVLENRKPAITIYNPCNEITRYYRNYNYFWDYFTEYLKKHFEVTENRYFENAHCERWKVNLQKNISDNVLVLDCEYIIENNETGEFHVISVSDTLTHASLNERANPYCKSVLVSQFHPETIKNHVNNYFFKYKPWLYFQALFSNLDLYYIKRKSIVNKVDTLFFKGTSLQDRTFLTHLNKDYVSDFNPISPDNYFNELIKHKLAISIDGRGEFCYRDVECFGVGVPIIRYEFESVFHEPLIPNYHYISIPRPNDMKLYRLGTKEHADKFMDKYFEVINNEELLNFISKNAREYYERNFTYDNICKITHRSLNLDAWL